MLTCDDYETPAGTARAENPLRKVPFFPKLVEAVPAASEWSITRTLFIKAAC
ncbi:hypothetical protein SAMN05421734_10357 [Pelagirhabdus alkalitolerans]|uniref:Uncharacterized protein n=1 Tax=Pelagirhabdus alkalitolerans TaxID=1612202 RepID=A0A1G6HJ82_9BACI|nr:hypothetical protein [Pelagirhabdus alkalitolerans]SDB94387.1 hypothetical protein SAMN05421734_10357 [Pelagirhabdus alkalitolerans]